MGNQQWFSTMDLASGYWQVAMSPEAKIKAAFGTNEGLFQFRVMLFSLCNAPATFERLMDRMLCGMLWSRCLAYLDDVISFVTSIPEALARLEEVLSCLSDFGLQLKAKKCTFMQTEVAFLGHIVGRTGLACDPAKISAVRNWHAPDKVKAVLQFVGFVGYYRRFVKDFAGLAEPLVALTRKGMLRIGHGCQSFCRGGVLNQIQVDREVVIVYASPSPFSAMVLYDVSGDVGGGDDVHAFSVISSWGSVHPSYISQLSPVAAEVLQWRWDVGSLVHVIGPVLGYF